ncbi:MAG TPA: class I SAM-dependent methyltransferase family protein [Thermodesulfobacteriota bacterium]|nr:class I SAM-dependent methyltransferase family protein [Thermodesulfobacteriota bacterium]
MSRKSIPSFEELRRPLGWSDPKKYLYLAAGFFLRTVGRLSDGIDTGFRHGFDSGMIMNYIYENVPRGKSFVGRALDAAFLDQTTCKAFRAVKQIQIEAISGFINERAGRETFIVDLASGKADYIFDVLGDTGANVKVLLRDISEKALAESRETALGLGLGGSVSFEVGDALDTESLRRIPRRPGLAIEAGLYGIIHDDGLVKKHLADLREIVAPEALLFNVQTYNEQIELIARTLVNQDGEPCVWHLRDKDLVIGWAEEAGFRDPVVRMDPYGIYAVVLVRN